LSEPIASTTVTETQPTESQVAETQAPVIPRLDAWVNFVYLATWSYLLYGLGNATPYLRSELNLSDFQAGLHGSALAVGVLAAGMGVDFVARNFGSRWLLDLGVAGFLAGVAAIALAPALAVSLTGALILGLAGGTLGTQVNVNLSRSDSATSRRLLSQANAVSMVTAGAAPVVMGLAIQTVGMWRLAMFVPVAAGLVLSAVRPRHEEKRAAARMPRGRLPVPYWFAWLFILVSVSIEFSFVFWGSTIVARQTGTTDADATLLASLFVAGMFIGRALLGRGLGASGNPRIILAAGLLIVLAGAGLVRVSTLPLLSGLGLFIGGIGTSGLFPIGMALAMDRAGRARFEAAARATLAAGLAVLFAPSALGLASDAVGVANAWPIIMLMATAGLVVLALTPRAGEGPETLLGPAA
jgi:MFS family permease